MAQFRRKEPVTSQCCPSPNQFSISKDSRSFIFSVFFSLFYFVCHLVLFLFFQCYLFFPAICTLILSIFIITNSDFCMLRGYSRAALYVFSSRGTCPLVVNMFTASIKVSTRGGLPIGNWNYNHGEYFWSHDSWRTQ